MSYHELLQIYFERSVALQWYWTVYILVIGGVLGFSTFRQRPELVTTILVTILYGCFAYKNLGAIVATAEERGAIREVIKRTSISGANETDPKHLERNLEIREMIEHKLPSYDT